ncbi:MAG: hypothetical protein F6K50_14555 [Moorea sp. SIO3I7]|uniref:hypothetical protein n=1 Tax=Moorena sp. SIO3I8 TaxID=2607833 RepID=UPI0013C29BA3|nr:hypothetical protein [Moorena sp. SIO3I8]NEN96703.1 hypothetical protein [Moorena sp. SIO3I7]NEO09548.1 hypothetical protein [Moorena sp. SIO3I8]
MGSRESGVGSRESGSGLAQVWSRFRELKSRIVYHYRLFASCLLPLFPSWEGLGVGSSVPDSPFPIPHSRFPIPDSRSPPGRG